MIIGNYGLKHKESITIYDSKNCNLCQKSPVNFFQIEDLGEIDSLSTNESHQQIRLTPLEKQILEILEKRISFECFKNSFK